MAGDLQQRIDSLRGKAQLLTQRYEKLLSDKREADTTIGELKAKLAEQSKEISLLRQQLEYLRVVSPTSVTPGDAQQSRAILVQIVRDIDKCISELIQ